MTNYYSAEISPYLYVQGCTVQVLPGYIPVISQGQLRDDTNNVNMVISEPITLSQGQNGVNGLDKGSLAGQQLYSVYVIGDAQQRVPPAAIYCLSGNYPALPYANGVQYNIKRLVGYLRTGYGLSPSPFTLSLVVGSGSFRSMSYDNFDSNNNLFSNFIQGSPTQIDLSGSIPQISSGQNINAKIRGYVAQTLGLANGTDLYFSTYNPGGSIMGSSVVINIGVIATYFPLTGLVFTLTNTTGPTIYCQTTVDNQFYVDIYTDGFDFSI